MSNSCWTFPLRFVLTSKTKQASVRVLHFVIKITSFVKVHSILFKSHDILKDPCATVPNHSFRLWLHKLNLFQTLVLKKPLRTDLKPLPTLIICVPRAFVFLAKKRASGNDAENSGNLTRNPICVGTCPLLMKCIHWAEMTDICAHASVMVFLVFME